MSSQRSRWSCALVVVLVGCGATSPHASEPPRAEPSDAPSAAPVAAESEVAIEAPPETSVAAPEPSPQPPPAEPCDPPSTACTIRDEVRALAASSASGTPATVTRSVVTTYGWGCRCPDYVDARTPDEASHPEQYVVVDPSSPSAPPTQPEYLGRFRLTGHYSGEWTTGPRGEGASSALHPTFVVESWCYEGPARRVSRDLRQFNRVQSDLPRCAP